MDLSPRAVIAGRYRVDTKVGAGGMGEVWLGEQVGTGVRVAVKTLLPAAAMHHEVVARFKREAYILGRIQSPNVARVVDFVADDLYGLVLVMEFVEGEPLSRLLQERTLTVEEGVDLANGLATALKDLHAVNIIHRDLKPGNIIMAPAPDGRRRAVVVDFGVSRVQSEKGADEDEELTGITRADMAVGTIEYMAPEQILNSRNVTPGSDIYAAGAMLFRSCAGRHVHGSTGSDAELAQKKLTTESPAIPLNREDKLAEGFAKVVARMVKRRPSERYKSADEVLADLAPLVAMARGIAQPVAAAVAVAPAAVAPAPVSTASPPVSSGAPASAPAAVAPPAPAVDARVSQPTPQPVATAPARLSAPDSSVGVTAPRPPEQAPPPPRGFSPAVTFGLVAAALAGGLFVGSRQLPPAPAPAAPPAVAAPQLPSATPPPVPTASAIAAAVTTGAPSADPSAAAATPTATASASAEPAASAAATAEAEAADAGGVPRFRMPGMMPRPRAYEAQPAPPPPAP